MLFLLLLLLHHVAQNSYLYVYMFEHIFYEQPNVVSVCSFLRYFWDDKQ